MAGKNEKIEFNLGDIDIEFLEDYLEVWGDERLKHKLAHITGWINTKEEIEKHSYKSLENILVAKFTSDHFIAQKGWTGNVRNLKRIIKKVSVFN